jgi:hypothetical protein
MKPQKRNTPISKPPLPETFVEDVAVPLLGTEGEQLSLFPEPKIAPKKPFWRNYKMLFAAWIIIFSLVSIGLFLNVDRFIIGDVVFLFGLISSAFTGLISLFGLVPWIGPILVKVLSIPFIWLINAMGYLVSLVAIRRGYSKDVLTYRGLTIAVIVGITIGYILGKLL